MHAHKQTICADRQSYPPTTVPTTPKELRRHRNAWQWFRQVQPDRMPIHTQASRGGFAAGPRAALRRA